MVLKFIFVGIWNILKFLVVFIATNVGVIYLYLFFGCGIYFIHIKKPLDDAFMLAGMACIVLYLTQHIDKKTKK